PSKQSLSRTERVPNRHDGLPIRQIQSALVIYRSHSQGWTRLDYLRRIQLSRRPLGHYRLLNTARMSASALHPTRSFAAGNSTEYLLDPRSFPSTLSGAAMLPSIPARKPAER